LRVRDEIVDWITWFVERTLFEGAVARAVIGVLRTRHHKLRGGEVGLRLGLNWDMVVRRGPGGLVITIESVVSFHSPLTKRMNWRGGIVIPGDYGEASEKLPIIGGGSTRQTKYYQQTWKRGEELKEILGHAGYWSKIQIFDMTDTANWPGNPGSCLKLAQGTDEDTRSGRDVWGLRLQVKCTATWQAYDSETATGINPQPTRTKLFVFVTRLKQSSDTIDKVWPEANELIDQAIGTEMPISMKNPRGEILAWGIMQADPEYYAEAHTALFLDGEPTGEFHQRRIWNTHSTELDFDISLKGSKFHYESLAAGPPVENDISVNVVRVNVGDITELTSGTCFSAKRCFSWSQAPPKRLWQAQGTKRGRDPFDRPDLDLPEKMVVIGMGAEDEGGMPELAEAAEAWEFAGLEGFAEAQEPAGKRAK
jgi:hypothetical protein